MATQYPLYIEVPGMVSPIKPEVSLVERHLLETQLYASDIGLRVLNSPEVNLTVGFIRMITEKEDPQWIQSHMKKYKATSDSVRDTVRKFREQFSKYLVWSEEILMWPSYPTQMKASLSQPVLLRDYKVEKKGRKYYIAEGKRITIDWLRKNGAITDEMNKLLGARSNTFVYSNPDSAKKFSGLNALRWDFGSAQRDELDSCWGPITQDHKTGFILSAYKEVLPIDKLEIVNEINKRNAIKSLKGFVGSEEFEYDIENARRAYKVLDRSVRGMTINDLARELGLNRHTVTKILERMLTEKKVNYDEKGPAKIFYSVGPAKYITKIDYKDNESLLIDVFGQPKYEGEEPFVRLNQIKRDWLTRASSGFKSVGAVSVRKSKIKEIIEILQELAKKEFGLEA